MEGGGRTVDFGGRGGVGREGRGGGPVQAQRTADTAEDCEDGLDISPARIEALYARVGRAASHLPIPPRPITRS